MCRPCERADAANDRWCDDQDLLDDPRVEYVAHSDMCGCGRCAREWEMEIPRQVFDRVVR